MHNIVKNTYSWRYVAERTERVYNYVMEQPTLNTFHRIKSNFSWGPIVGFYAVLYQIVEFLLIFLLEFFQPENDIDVARNFNTTHYLTNPHKFGDHEFKISSLGEI